MPKSNPEYTVSSVAQYVRLIELGGALHASPFTWFRGETRRRPLGRLLPSIARRPSQLNHEWETYQRFRQSAAAFLPPANLDEWDWLLYMQHYGIRTRLLDWTESALAALYFAVEEKKPSRDGADGIVWCLDPLRLNELAGRERALPCAGVGKGTDEPLNAYTIEKIHVSPAMGDFKPMAFIAQRSFPRLIAQQGTFTIVHQRPIALDSIRDDHLLKRILIPASAKRAMRDGLKALGITRLVMFPEIQSIAEGR